LLLGIFIFIPHNGEAHPPRDMEIVFIEEEQVLEISMIHVSSDPRDHFIRTVIVYKNGEETDKRLFTKQTTAQGLTIQMPLQAQSGDVIEVKAICNKAGFKTASITIE